MTKEGFSQVPEEQIDDKKPSFAKASEGEGKQQKKSAKTEVPDFVRKLKEDEKPKNWLKEKFDKWREND